SIGTLAAGVAHEVKNPLAILMMGLNYLSRKLAEPDDNVKMVLKEMRDAIEQADSITKGLLNFSASRQLEIRAEDLNVVVEDTVRLVRHALNSNRVEIIRDYGERLPNVGADKTQI